MNHSLSKIYQQLSSTYVCGSLERGPLDDEGRQHDIRIDGGEIGDFAEDLDSLDENGGDQDPGQEQTQQQLPLNVADVVDAGGNAEDTIEEIVFRRRFHVEG